jgi:lipopolysaccharide heptosyltransferase II
MINETREAYPDSSVTLLVPDYMAELFEGNPALDRILPIPERHLHGLIAVKKIKDLIGDIDFDVGYILPPSFGAASAFTLARVKERIGYIADGRRLLLTRPLALPTPLNSEHRSTLYFNLLRRGAGVSLEYVAPKIFLHQADIENAGAILAGFGLKQGEAYFVMSIRAVAASRRWGQANYTRLADAVNKNYRLRAVIIGSSDDAVAASEVAGELGEEKVISLAGKTSLRESAAVMSGGRFYVGNDSGPAHLAAAVEAPLVVLSGADDPKETSPISATKKLLYRGDLDCISCVKNHCPLKGEDYMRCMKDISLEMVMAAVDELMVPWA